MRKPDGQCIVEPTRKAAMDFVAPLKARKIPGVGRVTERILESLAIHTVGDIFARRGTLALLRGHVGLEGLLSSYLGLGSTVIQPGTRQVTPSLCFVALCLTAHRAERKSMGCESTFDVLWKPEDLRRKARLPFSRPCSAS